MAQTLVITGLHGMQKTITKEALCDALKAMPGCITFQTVLKDRYHDAIVGAFLAQSGPVRFCDIYAEVCRRLGATEDDAVLGIAPCPYSHERKDHRGIIRSWVEERSPHSRQHYFRGGKRVFWRQGERPLLFVNPFLGECNNRNNWMPYTHARGAGWSFNPTEALNWSKPSDEVLDIAAAAYRKRGMRGYTRTKAVPNVVVAAILA